MVNPFARVRYFYKETISELRKVAWSTPKELRNYTLVVLLTVALSGFYISVIDFSLFNLVSYITEIFR